LLDKAERPTFHVELVALEKETKVLIYRRKTPFSEPA